MSLVDEIAKAEKEAASQLAEAERLKKLSEAFPDIRKHTGRWNKVAFCSKSVNTKVERFDLRHNCGCCNDSPLEVWPYLETEHGKVYSDPPMFFVGKKDYWAGGDQPNPGWKAELKKAGIPEDTIGAVSMHFKRGRDEARERDNSLFEEDGDG